MAKPCGFLQYTLKTLIGRDDDAFVEANDDERDREPKDATFGQRRQCNVARLVRYGRGTGSTGPGGALYVARVFFLPTGG